MLITSRYLSFDFCAVTRSAKTKTEKTQLITTKMTLREETVCFTSVVSALVCSGLDSWSCCWRSSAAESACGAETADKGRSSSSDLPPETRINNNGVYININSLINSSWRVVGVLFDQSRIRKIWPDVCLLALCFCLCCWLLILFLHFENMIPSESQSAPQRYYPAGLGAPQTAFSTKV